MRPEKRKHAIVILHLAGLIECHLLDTLRHANFSEYVRLSTAGSIGGRNTGFKFLCWGFKLQGLTWSFIYLTSLFVQIGLRVHPTSRRLIRSPHQRGRGDRDGKKELRTASMINIINKSCILQARE
jgi:hypothetical protein